MERDWPRTCPGCLGTIHDGLAGIAHLAAEHPRIYRALFGPPSPDAHVPAETLWRAELAVRTGP